MGFSQWEHSVIPAGLGRRVNTFFSQARNSLAGAGVQRGRGGGVEGERGIEEKGTRGEEAEPPIPAFIQTAKMIKRKKKFV